MFTDRIAEQIRDGKIAVIPTDTLYGIVAGVHHKESVEKVYKIKKRSPEKACIVLLPTVEAIEEFGVDIRPIQGKIDAYWPGPNSLVVSGVDERWNYISRGLGSLAFRVPADKVLRGFLRISGPVIAPSANPEGMPTAKNIPEAQGYFGDDVDIYIDGGELNNPPSRLIKISPDEEDKVLR